MLRFNEYYGPDFLSYGSKIVPIFPVTRQFEFKGVPCSRKQFPLRLAYAITVHKSQGLTLLRVVLNINQREHCPGLSYVAISRVKALDGILFESPFDYSRFSYQYSPKSRDRELDISVRNNQLL